MRSIILTIVISVMQFIVCSAQQNPNLIGYDGTYKKAWSINEIRIKYDPAWLPVGTDRDVVTFRRRDTDNLIQGAFKNLWIALDDTTKPNLVLAVKHDSISSLKTGTLFFYDLNTKTLSTLAPRAGMYVKYDSSGVPSTDSGGVFKQIIITGDGFIKTAGAGAGANGWILDTAGIRGYSALLGKTFDLPSDGSAPWFSSGIIKDVIYEIYTSGVIRTSETVGDGTPNSAGILINNTGIYGIGANQVPASASVRILSDGSMYANGTFSGSGNSLDISSNSTITSINGTLSLHGTSITQNTNNIALKANSTTTDSLRNRISSAEAGISINATDIGGLQSNILLYAKKDSLVSFINIDPSGLRISGSKISIDGTVQFSSGYDPTTKIATGGAAADVNANTTTIDGGKLTAGTVIADYIVANISLTSPTITGGTLQTSTSGQRVVIDNSNTIKFYPPSGTAPVSLYGDLEGYMSTNARFSASSLISASFVVGGDGSIVFVRNGSVDISLYRSSDAIHISPGDFHTDFLTVTTASSGIKFADLSGTIGGTQFTGSNAAGYLYNNGTGTLSWGSPGVNGTYLIDATTVGSVKSITIENGIITFVNTL